MTAFFSTLWFEPNLYPDVQRLDSCYRRSLGNMSICYNHKRTNSKSDSCRPEANRWQYRMDNLSTQRVLKWGVWWVLLFTSQPITPTFSLEAFYLTMHIITLCIWTAKDISKQKWNCVSCLAAEFKPTLFLSQQPSQKRKIQVSVRPLKGPRSIYAALNMTIQTSYYSNICSHVLIPKLVPQTCSQLCSLRLIALEAEY